MPMGPNGMDFPFLTALEYQKSHWKPAVIRHLHMCLEIHVTAWYLGSCIT
jgi:hypothetical protein